MLGFTSILGLSLIPHVLGLNVANVLIYSYTAGYRHDSIPTAVEEMTARGPDYGINFANTEDPAKITEDYLSEFDVVFFLSNTDRVLTAAGQRAFQSYLDKGGNFVAIHAASQCQEGWSTIVRAIGSAFQYHPDFTNATMVVEADHPSTAGLPHRWNVTDEIYNFDRDPRDLDAVVVLSADETTYNDPGTSSSGQGSPHPISWYQEKNKGTNATTPGRSWYTGLGHASAAWKNEVFLSHIFGGVTWAIASNTTRATNPDAQVGSTGPEYVPPSTDGGDGEGDEDSHDSGSLASVQMTAVTTMFSLLVAGACALLL